MPPSTKSQSPGPSPAPKTTSLPLRTAKSKLAPAKDTKDLAGRPGSSGGVQLEKTEQVKKKNEGKTSGLESTTKPPKLAQAKETTDTAAAKPSTTTAPNRQRRKPRKLNKDAGPATTTAGSAAKLDKVDSSTNPTPNTEPPPSIPTTAELEALKSRVRGLESKVEDLYKTSSASRRGSDARSPRRRGKGRKGSSNTQVPTLSTIPAESGIIEELSDDDPELADEELVRLEGELEVARRDLDFYRPRARRTTSEDTEFVEEIPRGEPGGGDSVMSPTDRQVTLSGSYRIPLLSSVSMDDVKNIQSGVSAAQNVARSFLEQRRANASPSVNQNTEPEAAKPKPKPARSAPAKAKAKAKQQPKQTSSALTKATAVEDDGEGGKKSWGEWFGGYSVAISRAVKNIEAEAALESQRAGASSAKKGTQGASKGARPKAKANTKSSAKSGGQPLYE